MPVLTVQDVAEAGLVASYSAADVGGDTMKNSGKEMLHVKNGSGGALTVTVTAQSAAKEIPGYGSMTKGDVAVSIDAGTDQFIGPFPKDAFNTSSGNIAITYSGITSLTLAALKLDNA